MAGAERVTPVRVEGCTPEMGGYARGKAFSSGVAWAQVQGPRLQDGVAAGLLQAGQQFERGGTNRRGPKAGPKAGRGQARDDRHGGQPETQLDQGDAPAT